MTEPSPSRAGLGGTSRVPEPERLRTLPPYPLAGFPEARARLHEAGRDVLDLGAGDPGIPVPQVAVETLADAAARPELQRYGFQRGLPRFRQAVADFMRRRYDRDLDPEREVLPLIGSKEGLANLAYAVLDADSVALVPDPGYAPYFGGPHLAGSAVRKVPLRPDDGFVLPPDAIADADGNVRLVYLNYPNNPTGACVDHAYVEAVAAAAAARGALLAYDNAYAEIAFDGYRPPSLIEVAGGRESGLEFHSFSKSFNMTGWRLGWACGSADYIERLSRVKSFVDTGPYLAIQQAGAAVLDLAEPYLEENTRRLQGRRDAAVQALREVGLAVEAPRATLYLWFPVPTSETSRDFVFRLLEQEAVILLPGSGLGEAGEGWIRAALTLPRERYAEAAARIARAI